TGQTTAFDLGVTAYADETEGFGSPAEASAATSQHIELDFNHNAAHEDFTAQNQSIWSSGNAFAFDDDRFIGPDIEHKNPELNIPLVADITTDVTLKAGFHSVLHINAGSINADLPFDITLNTEYNKTTDTLQVDSTAVLDGGSFTTQGPGGQYNLDFE